MDHRRIVITGMGVVSCLGHEVDEYYENLLAGKSGIRTIQSFDPSNFSTKIAGEIGPLDTEGFLEKKQARRVDKFIQYAIVAGKKALLDAKLLENEDVNKKRCGVIIGSGMGGMSVFSGGLETLNEKGAKRISPFFIPYILTNMAGALLAIDVGFMGPNYSISTACATGNYSIIAAANHIRSGESDVMVCGGAESAVIPVALGGFIACKALSKRNEEPEKASRPWDKNRDGFVMGEGAGVLILEELGHALKRGVPIYAEYLGGATSCDAHHITEPHPEGKGVKICLEKTFVDAKIDEKQVNYINAHATATPAGDMAEVRGMSSTFSQPEKIYMNGTKSMIGHCLGAAGGVEAIATVKAIEKKCIHPNINIEDLEDNIPFQIPRKSQEVDIEVALSNSFGFGGHNASIAFAPYRG